MSIDKERLKNESAAAFVRNLINTLDAAGEAFLARKDAQAGLAFHQRALAISESTPPGKADDETFPLAVARTHNGIGLCLRTLGQPDDAFTHHEKARVALEALAATPVRSADPVKALASTHHYAALALIALGKVPEARRHHEKAVPLREKLANPNAWNVAFTLELADEYRAVHCLYRDAGDHANALRWCERAAMRFTTLAEDYPSLSWYALIRDEMQVRRTGSLVDLGRYQEAVESARHLLATRQLLGGELYNLACTFAVAASKAREDAKLTMPERERLARTYEGEAIRLLRQAEAAGYFKHPGTLAEMKKDTDFQELRSTPEFKALTASLEAGGRSDGRSEGSGGRR
jgi:tetratricopeptide (TPR) repeat protein